MFSDIPSHFVLPLSACKSILHPNQLYMGLFLCVGYFFFVTPKTVFVQIQACKLTIGELLIALGFPVRPISHHPMPVPYTDLCVSTSLDFCCNIIFIFLSGFEGPKVPLDTLQGLLLEGGRGYSRAGSFTSYPVSQSYLSRSCPTRHPGPGTMTWGMQHMIPFVLQEHPLVS